MRKALLALAVLAISLPLATGAIAATKTHPAHPFSKHAAKFDAGAHPFALTGDCDLVAYNLCSSWIWVFNAAEGSVWGAVFSADMCPSGCATGGAVNNVLLYSRCNITPGHMDGVRIASVDASDCPTATLCDSGPLDLIHCVSGDRWTNVPMPLCHTGGNPFAVEIVWGPQSTPGTNDVQFATDNGIANLLCSLGAVGTFPGCFSSTPTCPGWVMGAQSTFVYVTDFNGDTILDDLCALYGAPYALAFPYLYPYGYIPNNLILGVSLDCTNPTATEPTSWGHVKALYQ